MSQFRTWQPLFHCLEYPIREPNDKPTYMLFLGLTHEEMTALRIALNQCWHFNAASERVRASVEAALDKATRMMPMTIFYHKEDGTIEEMTDEEAEKRGIL